MRLPLLTTLLLTTAAAAQIPGPHRPGPHGLSAWKISAPLPNPDGTPNPSGELTAYRLIIARNAHPILTITPDNLLWKWTFLADGRRLAYQSGPLHFSMGCYLVALPSGHRLAHFNCTDDQAPNTPAWVKTLNQAPE